MKVDEYTQVKMYKKRHQEIKVFSAVNGRKLYEVIDTACKEFLDRQDNKGVKSKEEK